MGETPTSRFDSSVYENAKAKLNLTGSTESLDAIIAKNKAAEAVKAQTAQFTLRERFVANETLQGDLQVVFPGRGLSKAPVRPQDSSVISNDQMYANLFPSDFLTASAPSASVAAVAPTAMSSAPRTQGKGLAPEVSSSVAAGILTRPAASAPVQPTQSDIHRPTGETSSSMPSQEPKRGADSMAGAPSATVPQSPSPAVRPDQGLNQPKSVPPPQAGERIANAATSRVEQGMPQQPQPQTQPNQPAVRLTSNDVLKRNTGEQAQTSKLLGELNASIPKDSPIIMRNATLSVGRLKSEGDQSNVPTVLVKFPNERCDFTVPVFEKGTRTPKSKEALLAEIGDTITKYEEEWKKFPDTLNSQRSSIVSGEKVKVSDGLKQVAEGQEKTPESQQTQEQLKAAKLTTVTKRALEEANLPDEILNYLKPAIMKNSTTGEIRGVMFRYNGSPAFSFPADNSTLNNPNLVKDMTKKLEQMRTEITAGRGDKLTEFFQKDMLQSFQKDAPSNTTITSTAPNNIKISVSGAVNPITLTSYEGDSFNNVKWNTFSPTALSEVFKEHLEALTKAGFDLNNSATVGVVDSGQSKNRILISGNKTAHLNQKTGKLTISS